MQGLLAKEISNEITVNVGEPEVPALVPVGQALVVDPELIQDCRVQVMNVNGIAHHVVGEVVRFTVDVSFPYSAPS